MNIAQLLAATSARHPDNVAIQKGSATTTFRTLMEQVSAIAGWLQQMGLSKGDRVAIAMQNCPEYIPILFGCWSAGLCAVPINAKLHSLEFKYILDNAQARMCFTDRKLETTLSSLIEELQHLDSVINIHRQNFPDILNAPPVPLCTMDPNEPAWLFYTSGTTGSPKGAVLTHRNLLAMTLIYYADLDQLSVDDGILHAGPLSHGSGLYVLPHIARGARQIFLEADSFDPCEVSTVLKSNSNISFFAAPTMITRLINDPSMGSLHPNSVKSIIYGGAPMYLSDLKRAIDCFGPKLAQIYGQGETPMTITALSKYQHRQFYDRDEILQSAGTARTGVEVAIFDKHGHPLTNGNVGEIATRSDCVMSGYWHNESATQSTIRDGWLYTGDIGSINDNGFLTLKSRSKDLIISGGMNIYPREVEDTLLLHPAVFEVAVIGRPDPDWGESVVAYIVCREGHNVTSQDLDAQCLSHMARFKRPKEYYFVSTLPKSAYGKILKTELRAKMGVPAS